MALGSYCIFLKLIFIYLLLAALGLCCYTGFPLVAANRGYSLVACAGFSLVAEIGGYSLAMVLRRLIVEACFVAEHGL